MSTIKLLFLTKFYSPHLGGVEKHVSQVSNLLTKSGNAKVTVLTEKYDNRLSSDEVSAGIRIARFKYPHIRIIGLFLIWFELLKKIKLVYESDVIHVHDVFIWILPLRVIFFWKKMYITFHGWEGRYPIPLSSLLQKKLAYFLTDGNICIGKYLEQLYGIKSTVVTYGSTEINLSLRKLRKNPKIIYIGRLESDTGLPLLIGALRSTGYKATFYGDGPLRADCTSVGVVKGFVKDVSYALENCDICFAGGYLSTIDSMAASRLTAVITHNFVRKIAFEHEAFSKLITICHSERQIINFLKHYSTESFKIKLAHEWAISQTWEKTTKLYLNLWNA